MSDVFDEMVERLKQKAKTRFELQQTFEEEHVTAKEEWVRLEDVTQLLQKIKEKYALIPKKKLIEKLAEIKLYGTKINGQLSDKPEYSPHYLADFIEKELLKEC